MKTTSINAENALEWVVEITVVVVGMLVVDKDKNGRTIVAE